VHARPAVGLRCQGDPRRRSSITSATCAVRRLGRRAWGEICSRDRGAGGDRAGSRCGDGHVTLDPTKSRPRRLELARCGAQ
jgi:hypothetical protein